MIVCFTTTYRALYHRDLLDVVCLPCGEPVRFGYRSSQVEPSLRGRVGGGPGSALVVFADYVREPGPARYEFYPVRRVRVDGIQRESRGGVTVEMETGYWHLNPWDGALDEFRELVAALPRRPSLVGEEAENTFVVRPPTDDLRRWTSAAMLGRDWLPTAHLLRESVGLGHSTFFRQNPEGRAPDMGSTLRAAGRTGAVWANRTYDVVLDVLEPRRGALEVPTIQSVYGSHVHGPLLRQSEGGLVTVTYKVSVPETLVGSMWSARIGGETFVDSEEPRAMMPELQATGKVRNSVGKWVALLLAGGLLIGGHVLNSTLFGDGDEAFGVRLKVVGALMFAAGVFLLLGVRRTALPTA